MYDDIFDKCKLNYKGHAAPLSYVWDSKNTQEVLLYCSYLNISNNTPEKTVGKFGWTILSLLLSVIRRHLTLDPLPLVPHTHTYGPSLSPLLWLCDWPSKNYFLRPPPHPALPLGTPCTSSVPAPSFLPLQCSATPSSWRRCSLMCPSRASNVVTGPGTTGLH